MAVSFPFHPCVLSEYAIEENTCIVFGISRNKSTMLVALTSHSL